MPKIEQITLKELFGSATDGNFPILIDIQHDALDLGNGQEAGHLRAINNNTAVIFKGWQYIPSSFQVTQPSEDGQKIGGTSLSISAIDQKIISTIRKLRTPPIAIIEYFFAKLDEDRFLFSKLGHYEFTMSGVTWDEKAAKWTLIFDPIMQTAVPKALGTNARCPSVTQDDL